MNFGSLIFYCILAAIQGLCNTTQGGMNGRFNIAIDCGFYVILYVFGVGFVLNFFLRLGEAYFYADPNLNGQPSKNILEALQRTIYYRPGAPWFQWWYGLSGFIGVQFVCAITYLPNELTLKQTFVLQIVANQFASLLIDHFGWTGMPISRTNWIRLLGLLVAIAGAILTSVKQIKDNPPDASIGLTIGLILCALVSGFLLPFQTTQNIKLGSEDGPVTTAISALLYSYFFSMPLAIIMAIIYSLIDTSPYYGLKDTVYDVPWFSWFTGAVGFAFISLALYVCPRLGTAIWTAVMLAGQLISSLILEHYDVFGLGKVKAEALDIIGVCLVILGVVILQIGAAYSNTSTNAVVAVIGENKVTRNDVEMTNDWLNLHQAQNHPY